MDNNYPFGEDTEYMWGGDVPFKPSGTPKDPLVVKTIETLTVTEDELLIIKYPSDYPLAGIQAYAEQFKKEVASVMGDLVAERIMFVPDPLDFTQIKMDTGPKTHPIYGDRPEVDGFD